MRDAGIYSLTTNKGMGKERVCDRLHWRKTWTKTHQHQRLFFHLSPSHTASLHTVFACVCVSHSPCRLCGSKCTKGKCLIYTKSPLNSMCHPWIPHFISFLLSLSFLSVNLSLFIFHSTNLAKVFITIVVLFSLDDTLFLLKSARDKYFECKVELLFCMKYFLNRATTNNCLII